jgi:hypothetical protein
MFHVQSNYFWHLQKQEEKEQNKTKNSSSSLGLKSNPSLNSSFSSATELLLTPRITRKRLQK